MAAFLNQDIQTLDLEEVSRIFQSEASIAGPSNVTEDEGFMRWMDESVKLFIALYHEHSRTLSRTLFPPSWRSSRKPALHGESLVMTLPRPNRVSAKNGRKSQKSVLLEHLNQINQNWFRVLEYLSHILQ